MTASHVCSTAQSCGHNCAWVSLMFAGIMQDDLPGLYRGHDVFLFTSRYEAWGMPVLEAMASGVAVVSSKCLGVQSFAVHGVNALLADPQVLLAPM